MSDDTGPNVTKLVVEAILALCPDLAALTYLVQVDLNAARFLQEGFVASDPLGANCLALYQWYLRYSRVPELARLLRLKRPADPAVIAAHVAVCPDDPQNRGAVRPHRPCCVDGRDVFIDREDVIAAVEHVETHGYPRVIVVHGTADSGRRFCARIVGHLAQQSRSATIAVDLTRTLTPNGGPDDVVRAIALKAGFGDQGMPAQGHRDYERWATQLVDWLVGHFGQLHRRAPSERWWVIVHGFEGRPGEEITRSVLLYLAESIEASLPQVRLCLVGFDAAVQPPLRDQIEFRTIGSIGVEELKHFYRAAAHAHGKNLGEPVIDTLAREVLTHWDASPPGPNETKMYVLRRLVIDAGRRCGIPVGGRL